MTGIKQLRQSLGISQQAMADYLSISRSHLSMVEIGHRSHPSAMLLKLLRMEIKLAGAHSTHTRAVTEKQAASTNNMLRRKAEAYSVQATIANYKLEAMLNEYEQCLKTIDITYILLDDLATGN